MNKLKASKLTFTGKEGGLELNQLITTKLNLDDNQKSDNQSKLRAKFQTQLERKKEDLIKVLVKFGIEDIDPNSFSDFKSHDYLQLRQILRDALMKVINKNLDIQEKNICI